MAGSVRLFGSRGGSLGRVGVGLAAGAGRQGSGRSWRQRIAGNRCAKGRLLASRLSILLLVVGAASGFGVAANACTNVEIRNVSVSPSTMAPGSTFTVSFEFYGTGPTYPYEHRWVSETDGGNDLVCH